MAILGLQLHRLTSIQLGPLVGFPLFQIVDLILKLSPQILKLCFLIRASCSYLLLSIILVVIQILRYLFDLLLQLFVRLFKFLVDCFVKVKLVVAVQDVFLNLLIKLRHDVLH